MIPVHFGDAERVLAGVYSPAVGASQRRGAVICPPFGQEHLRVHRTGRVMAVRLAAAGVDVLRFDYFGTGESYGASHEMTLQGAVADARAAVREVVDLAGVRRVSLVGIRAGALVAALAARGDRAVDRVVLCDPVLDGESYVRELLALADDRPRPDGFPQVRGFPLTERLRAGLAEHGAEVVSDLPGRILLVVSHPVPESDDLTERVKAREDGSRAVRLSGEPYWSEGEGINVGAVPSALIDEVVAWPG